ncbi:helix-turn-helix domain-containing protein [Methylobacterium soli]|uniref:Helix-turn-helix domain-containing protein n=1 Tax=Methylobacterium soli TaxID=553447 RepID=A0A6L3SPF2_9HYPH|nr:helix-turn-helix domain-containing protein [Methylobacterium soli]KAB1071008.1 helix-turn-helix domain-containing protein [Methylobacterium soli]GJE44907.1 Transcriptional activator FeaR [Methylobacterium soli]
MKTVFSTEHVHPRDRFDFWYSVARKGVVDHASKPSCRNTFRAQLRSGSVGSIDLVLFQNSEMSVTHERRHIAQANTDELFICRQFRGHINLGQDGRQVVLMPGDITLIDPRLPYQAQFSEASEVLVLKVPRQVMEARLGQMREMTALSVAPCTAENSLLSASLAMLPLHTDGLGPTAVALLEPHLLDLITLALGRTKGEEASYTSSARSLVRVRLRAAVEARLADRTLDASTVARAAGVSVRHANAVLAEERTSIMRLIQERRLARCRQALEDPLQMGRTVSEIAYGWGFSDMTHFGRRFRSAYGVLPSEHRRRARAQLCA